MIIYSDGLTAAARLSQLMLHREALTPPPAVAAAAAGAAAAGAAAAGAAAAGAAAVELEAAGAPGADASVGCGSFAPWACVAVGDPRLLDDAGAPCWIMIASYDCCN